MALDDDAPLSALTAKAPKVDDDAPLAALASAGKPKASKPSDGAKHTSSKPNDGTKPMARFPSKPSLSSGKVSKPRESSSSSDSSSDSSDSSDSKATKMPRKKRVVTPGQRQKMLKKPRAGKPGDDEDENGEAEDEPGEVGYYKKADRSTKQQLVAELLCRWWYVMDDWPPTSSEHYEAEFKKRSLRQVSIDEWEWVPNVDANGRTKVYALMQFPGVYRNAAGELVDLRPHDTCPCYNNFMKKGIPELYQLLVTAYENQLKDLEKSGYDEKKLRDELQTMLTKARHKAQQAAEMVPLQKSLSSRSISAAEDSLQKTISTRSLGE